MVNARPRLVTALFLVTALCAAVALLAACTLPAPVTGTPTRGGGDTPAPQLQRFYAQKLSWGPCKPFATTVGEVAAFSADTLQCARLQVPLDYAKPDGPAAGIAVLRQKATGSGSVRSCSTPVAPARPA